MAGQASLLRAVYAKERVPTGAAAEALQARDHLPACHHRYSALTGDNMIPPRQLQQKQGWMMLS